MIIKLENHRLQIRERNIPVAISMFILLFLSFHVNAFGILHINTSVLVVLGIIIIFSAALIGLRTVRNVPNPLICIWLLILSLSFINNGYIENGGFSNPLIFALSIIAAFVLHYTNDWYDILKKCLVFFSFEHFIISWLFWIFRGFYNSTIIPMFSAEYRAWLTKWSDSNVLLGLVNNYSTSGIYFSIAVIVMFAAWMAKKKKTKIDVVWLLLMLFSLFMTQKRGPLFFCIIAIIAAYFIYEKIKAKTIFKFLSIVLIIIILLILVIQIFPSTSGLIDRLVQDNEQDDITSGRIPLYEYAISLFKQNPLFGIGWGQYRYSYIREIGTHNIYLQILAETGIVGAALIFSAFIYGLVISVRLLRKSKEYSQPLRFAILFSFAMQVFFLLYGITGNPLYDPQCYIPYFLSVAVVCSIYKNKSYLTLNARKKNENRNYDFCAYK